MIVAIAATMRVFRSASDAFGTVFGSKNAWEVRCSRAGLSRWQHVSIVGFQSGGDPATGFPRVVAARQQWRCDVASMARHRKLAAKSSAHTGLLPSVAVFVPAMARLRSLDENP